MQKLRMTWELVGGRLECRWLELEERDARDILKNPAADTGAAKPVLAIAKAA